MKKGGPSVWKNRLNKRVVSSFQQVSQTDLFRHHAQ